MRIGSTVTILNSSYCKNVADVIGKTGTVKAFSKRDNMVLVGIRKESPAPYMYGEPQSYWGCDMDVWFNESDLK